MNQFLFESSVSLLGNYQIFLILNADFMIQDIRPPLIEEGKNWYRAIDTSLVSDETFQDECNETPLLKYIYKIPQLYHEVEQ